MKRLLITTTLLAFSLFHRCAPGYAQQSNDTRNRGGLQPKNGMTATPHNYTHFTPEYRHASAEAIKQNAGYEQHPDMGVLYPGAPCSNCYELISARTETTKTFVKEGTNGRDIMEQTSSMPMHYLDASGNWRTINSQLAPAAAHGVYAANEQESPIEVNTTTGYTAIGKAGSQFSFNKDLELVFLRPDGTEQSLGSADWSHYTAGDEGVFVTNAWPGVDIEMYAVRNALKTNFYINHAMPAYAGGKLAVRDHIRLDAGLSLNTGSTNRISGNLEIRDNRGHQLYSISTATAGEKGALRSTLRMLDYHFAHGALDIELPGDFLNRPASAYPVIIDPLVSTPTVTPVTGSTYSPLWTIGCPYLNAANVPANCTVTDIQWSFNYITTGGAWLDEGSVDFVKGACRSPGMAGYYWFCNVIGAGTCTGSAISIFTDMSACVPAPQCASYPLNITMNFYQNYNTTAACASTYVYGATPLTITVFGHTVEVTSAGATASPTTVCAGQTVTLTGTGTAGVPPYSYGWTPGTATGSPATVTPSTTTTYTLTITDACGITATATTTVTVNPLAPITGTLTACVGNTTALANASGPGTWSCSPTTVATIGASTGVVNGVSAGTAIVTFTTPVGCTTTAVVTITPIPGAITGTPVVCSGLTTALANATPGGAWSSSNTAVATVSATGIVTGVSGGTSTISYSFGGSCYVSQDVTVNQTPAITSTAFTNPTTCGASDGTITLHGLTPGMSYSVTYNAPTPVMVTIVADASGDVVITGLPQSTYTNIKVTTAAGCVSNVVGPITLVDTGTPPTPTATATSPVCSGDIVTLNGTSIPGVGFHWTGPFGFNSALASPTVNPLTPTNVTSVYTYTLIVTNGACSSAPATVTVTVNPLPVVANIVATNPTTCFGTDGTVTLTGLKPGTSYDVTYNFNATFTGPVTIVADAAGNVVVTGLSSGTYSNFILTSLTCTSTPAGPAVLTDPGAPPVPSVTFNNPLCVGETLSLQAVDGVAGGTWSWTFPNGSASVLQNPQVANMTLADTGIYTVTYTVANCISTSSVKVNVYPPITLYDMTPSQTIKYGETVQLGVFGATYYYWIPSDGSLDNPNISNPIAKPEDSTTYTVYGMSQYGCKDSAKVRINVDFDMDQLIPSAFTPNGDHLNDIFRIKGMKYQRLVDFSVYNRWGELVYHNTTDPTKGWDGTYNGVPQDMGVYNYSITISVPDGGAKMYRGTVTLIR